MAVMMDNVRIIPISDITLDRNLWPRDDYVSGRVDLFAKLMREDEDADFPPVYVRRDARGRVVLVDGWHRLAAAALIGKTTVPAVEVDSATSPTDIELYADAVKRTLGASPLSRSEQMDAARKMRAAGMIERDVARVLGVDRSTVNRWITARDGFPIRERDRLDVIAGRLWKGCEAAAEQDRVAAVEAAAQWAMRKGWAGEHATWSSGFWAAVSERMAEMTRDVA